MPNRLGAELSPYLLQHAGNPVDWYPWGDEASRQARKKDKPIFLSIGYSSCHWCHVMAHESFESDRVAALLAEHFVSVKVDREERPDLDHVYMDAVQAMTGQGGWPLSVFLTPEGRPFFGGTYWPYPARGGMPGFDEVLLAIAGAWHDRRADLVEQAERLTEFLLNDAQELNAGERVELSEQPLIAAEATLRRAYDAQWGGFGQAPKFPQPGSLRLLLHRWRTTGNADLLHMVVGTLDRMATGGMYDQLGGGFHRYSVDRQWLVPHFEKMLYDNAQLAACYTEAWQATGREEFARVARETLGYVLRDMTHPEGGFFSSEDADSEGREGTFYLWTPEEVCDAIGPDRAEMFCRVYDVTPAGNFEGRSIPNLPRSLEDHARAMGRPAEVLAAELSESRATLLAVREKRVRPGRDDKVLVGWNALMMDSLALAGSAFGESAYLEAAVRAAEFLLGRMRDGRTRLLHYWRAGQVRQLAFLDDIALLAGALTTLHESTGDARWLNEAVRLADDLLARFADRTDGGFFYTPTDYEPLIARKKGFFDGAAPSGNGAAATVLLRLARLCDRPEYREAAEATVRAAWQQFDRAPTAAGQLLLALEDYLATE